MAFSTVWDETKPAGSRDLNLGDDDIREFKKQLRERLEVDHYFLETEAADTKIGYHSKATFLEQAADPTSLANALIMYAKLSGSYSELFVQHENAGIVQLTSLGKLLASSLTIASEAQGDILYRGASGWVRLGAGTAGYVLSSGGAGADPSWIAPTAAEIESGMIILWSGSAATIPSGWVLCNGSNSTPDLRDKFVIGAGNLATEGANGGIALGGTESSLTLTTSNGSGATGAFPGGSDAIKAEHTHQSMPPYYALCYIMKS